MGPRSKVNMIFATCCLASSYSGTTIRSTLNQPDCQTELIVLWSRVRARDWLPILPNLIQT
jgi:hypothetical protein